jgi:Amt family ammonium transporter
MAMTVTQIATAAAALAWMFTEWLVKGKPSVLGICSGAVAGLVAITPASGFVAPVPSIVIGILAGIGCYFAATSVKTMLGYDDALDAFGVHCIGGIIGALGTGILAAPLLGGTGVFDYTTGKVGDYDMLAQLITQAKAVCLTLIWSGVGSFILFNVVKMIVGLRPATDQEREGLDLVDHGERAYNY